MSTGIIWMLSTPSTIKVSDMTVTAYGFPSEARIRPFMRNLSRMIEDDQARGSIGDGMIGPVSLRATCPDGFRRYDRAAGRLARREGVRGGEAPQDALTARVCLVQDRSPGG